MLINYHTHVFFYKFINELKSDERGLSSTRLICISTDARSLAAPNCLSVAFARKFKVAFFAFHFIFFRPTTAVAASHLNTSSMHKMRSEYYFLVCVDNCTLFIGLCSFEVSQHNKGMQIKKKLKLIWKMSCCVMLSLFSLLRCQSYQALFYTQKCVSKRYEMAFKWPWKRMTSSIFGFPRAAFYNNFYFACVKKIQLNFPQFSVG